MPSKEVPFVSGMIRQTKINCKIIMIAKKENVAPPPKYSEMIGKENAMIAAINQCVKLPSAWPLARTSFGKISEIKTHITAPCEKAKKAI